MQQGRNEIEKLTAILLNINGLSLRIIVRLMSVDVRRYSVGDFWFGIKLFFDTIRLLIFPVFENSQTHKQPPT